MEGEDKGRVVAHEDFVVLKDAKPKVSKAGRERVLREKRKNVHAGVVGEWIQEPVSMEESEAFALTPYMVTYNPYKADHFYYRDYPVGIGWHGSPFVLMNANADDKVMVFDNID